MRIVPMPLLYWARYVASYGGLKRGKETKQRTEAAFNNTRYARKYTRYEFRTFTHINLTILIFLRTCNLFYIAPRFIINLWLFLLKNNKIRVASLYIYINSIILIFLYTCNFFYIAPIFIRCTINLWLFLLGNANEMIRLKIKNIFNKNINELYTDANRADAFTKLS